VASVCSYGGLQGAGNRDYCAVATQGVSKRNPCWPGWRPAGERRQCVYAYHRALESSMAQTDASDYDIRFSEFWAYARTPRQEDELAWRSLRLHTELLTRPLIMSNIAIVRCSCCVAAKLWILWPRLCHRSALYSVAHKTHRVLRQTNLTPVRKNKLYNYRQFLINRQI